MKAVAASGRGVGAVLIDEGSISFEQLLPAKLHSWLPGACLGLNEREEGRKE